jgi:small subunit ribosomal protein S20
MPSQSGAPLDLASGADYVSALLLRVRFSGAIRRSTEVAVPRIQSAKKRMRQAVVHAAQNRTQRSRLRTALKKVRSVAADEVEKAYADAVQLLDRAGRKRLIHPNAAARHKSRLAKLKAKASGA